MNRRDVTVRVKSRVVKAIITFPLHSHVCIVGVGVVLKVPFIEVNMVYYKFIFFIKLYENPECGY
jgi:hypothetical protein